MFTKQWIKNECNKKQKSNNETQYQAKIKKSDFKKLIWTVESAKQFSWNNQKFLKSE